MKTKFPKLIALVTEIVGEKLNEIEILKIEIVCIEIEKEELKRNIEMAGNVPGEAPQKESK